ncbi:MAG: sel1 repeat family protein [Abditibacteriota bacterium]|nr:sel1 repeat family protein [Abditibacteriota bacterium]
MTLREAKDICIDYHYASNPSEEDSFMYTEALGFLIEETGDPNYMVELGAHYYRQRQFDLALKYYEQAAEYDNIYAISDLGYIWYYGRTGEKNYEKAFYYFDRAAKMGDTAAAYKVADMYKNGYWVEQDYGKYASIIKDLYKKPGRHLPEIYSRLAGIYDKEGRTAEALELRDTARGVLAERIARNPFFGNLTIMKWLIEGIYALRPFDPGSADIYDLYHVFASPAKALLRYNGKDWEAEAVPDGDGLGIRLGDRWFRTIDDFFAKAEIEGERITALYEYITVYGIDQ